MGDGEFEFNPGDVIFDNRNALLDDYTPEKLVGRDNELRQYHETLQPAIEGSEPDNIFLFGKTGVGKTASTKFLLERLQAGGEEHGVNITTERLNCDGLDTSYRVAVALVNTFRGSDQKISETGHPRSKVYDMMWDAFDRRGGIIILVLDEIDHLQDNSLLYQLSRARENENLDNARVSVVGISNDLSYRDRLSPKVRSSLCERSINFPAYDADELQEVLRQRAGIAFRDNALDEAVIPLCAAYGAQESGDARKALDLLLKAGDIAKARDVDTVAESHVEQARDIIEQEEVADGIHGLNEHERLLLYSVTTFEAAEAAPVRSRKVYERYQRFCGRVGNDALTNRWMHDHLDEMAMLGLVQVEKRNEGSTKGGGQYKEVALNQDLELVVEALDKTMETVGIHENLQSELQSSK